MELGETGLFVQYMEVGGGKPFAWQSVFPALEPEVRLAAAGKMFGVGHTQAVLWKLGRSSLELLPRRMGELHQSGENDVGAWSTSFCGRS